MGQPSADRQGETYSVPQVHPGAIQPYSAQPYSAQSYSAQPYPAPAYLPAPVAAGNLVSAGGRFGAFVLDLLLCLVTLGIGYLIWSLITWSDGQTPAKKLLGHVVVDEVTGVPFDWGRMALRQFVIEGLLGGLLNTVSFGIYFWVDSLTIFGDRQRTLHDRMAKSVVRFV